MTLWGIDRHPVQAYEAIAFAAVAAYVLPPHPAWQPSEVGRR